MNAMTPSLVQRIAGTPGILKKMDSPSTAEKKLRRVHFDNSLESNIAKANSDGIDKGFSLDEPIPASPKGILKSPAPRRPFANVQLTEEKASTTPSLDNNPSPDKSETNLDDEPLFVDLMDCQESIAKVINKLVPISTNIGSITLRKTLEARGIVQIRHLACMTRREVAALNIKKPRVETAMKALAQFARDYSPQKQRAATLINH
ncbi:unnamed protein product, partial [Strongylus vulgaris]